MRADRIQRDKNKITRVRRKEKIKQPHCEQKFNQGLDSCAGIVYNVGGLRWAQFPVIPVDAFRSCPGCPSVKKSLVVSPANAARSPVISLCLPIDMNATARSILASGG